MLLTVDDWERMAERAVPEPDGPLIVAIDLGGGRSWSAAVAVWQNGRVEALAVAPGIPGLEAQEERDHVPATTYTRLAAEGRLSVAEGLRVQPAAALWGAVMSTWGRPVKVIADRFRVPELQDAVQGAVPVEPRIARWSEASEDIRALRKLVKDGPLVVSEESRSLVSAALAVAKVKNDDQGNTRLVKRDSNNTARDDVAAALVLAAGAWQRASQQPKGRLTHVVIP